MKNIITAMALAGALLASCARERVDLGGGRQKSIGFNFRVAGDFDPATREATIYSTDAIQNIEVAKVFVFQTADSGASYQYVKTYDFDADWVQGNNSVTRQLAVADMLPDGKYRFLAVGADNNSDYTLPTFAAGTDFSTVTAQLAAARPQELFAGYADDVFDQSIESVTIIMHRRVSGVLLYVKNAPVQVSTSGGGSATVGYLRLSIAAGAQTINITDGNPADTTPYPADQPGYDVLNVDLRAQGDADGDGFYDGKAIGGGVGQLPGTTVVGAYIVPGLHSAVAQPTMVLKLMGTDGTTMLRSWNVKNSASGLTTYDIKSNYVYSLGRKLKSALTDNGTPTDPSDDDQPIDLSRSQTIDARINSGWEQVVQMMLDDSANP